MKFEKEKPEDSIATKITRLAAKVSKKADRVGLSMGLSAMDVTKAMALAFRARTTTNNGFHRDIKHL